MRFSEIGVVGLLGVEDSGVGVKRHEHTLLLASHFKWRCMNKPFSFIGRGVIDLDDLWPCFETENDSSPGKHSTATAVFSHISGTQPLVTLFCSIVTSSMHTPRFAERGLSLMTRVFGGTTTVRSRNLIFMYLLLSFILLHFRIALFRFYLSFGFLLS